MPLVIIELILAYFVISILWDLFKIGAHALLSAGYWVAGRRAETETERRERRAKAEEKRIAEIVAFSKMRQKEIQEENEKERLKTGQA
jgi:hypothetical protein